MNYSAKDIDIRALVVGINNYVDSRSLRYCVDDATSVRDLLQGICDRKNIILVTDGLEPRLTPLRSNILSNIKLISETAEENENVFFYFAGHGKDINGEPVLLPSDYRDEIGLNTAIKIEDVKKALVNSKAKFKLLVLDSCHSGAVKGREGSGRMSSSMFDALDNAPEGFAIISACSLNQISFESEKLGHGVFTFFLLEGMKGKADANGNKEVTLDELYNYVYTKVKDWVFRECNALQKPHKRCNFGGIYIVNRLSGETLVLKDTVQPESVQDATGPSRLKFFKEIFNFAYSYGGLNMSKEGARQFALQWCEQWSNSNFEFFKEIFNFAFSYNGLNMTKKGAREFALEWLGKRYDKDFQFFKEIFNFAYSYGGLNMSKEGARRFALQWLELHKPPLMPKRPS